MDYTKIGAGYSGDDGHPDGDEPLVFRYSREERLKHAPKIVQDYYSGASAVKRGLLRSLVATKGNRFMLMSVGLCVGVVLLASVLLRRDSASVYGVDTRLSAFSFDDAVYVSVQLGAAGSRYAHASELPLPVSAGSASSAVISPTTAGSTIAFRSTCRQRRITLPICRLRTGWTDTGRVVRIRGWRLCISNTEDIC